MTADQMSEIFELCPRLWKMAEELHATEPDKVIRALELCDSMMGKVFPSVSPTDVRGLLSSARSLESIVVEVVEKGRSFLDSIDVS